MAYITSRCRKRLLAAFFTASFALMGSGCASHPKEPVGPLQLGPGEVAIDQNFKMFIISDRGMKLQALFFISIQQASDARMICSAFYYSKSKVIKGIEHVDLAGTNASFRFDDGNSVIEQAEKGDEFNFSFPNHKARCVAKPVNYSLDIKQPQLNIYAENLSNGASIPAKLGISMDLHTLKTITMQ